MAGTVVITGANGSLALGFVQSLLALYPQHTLIATVRNPLPEKDPNTAQLMRLISKHPQAKVLVEALDLGRLTDPISAIVCNAATLSLDAGLKFTSDGYEATFQVCHLSHYLLVLKLLGSMDPGSGRIIFIGSVTHYPEKPNPLSSLRPEFPESVDELVRPLPDQPTLVHDRGFQRYGTAKLANVTFVNDLNKRLVADPNLSQITATAMDPGGLTASRAQAVQKKPVRRLMATINFFMPVLKYLTTTFRTTEDAGRDLVAVSVGPEFHGKRGYYIGQKPDAPAAVSENGNEQRRLWEACWKWAGLSSGETALLNADADTGRV
ncbi:hypothetical protein VTI74DRAFT_10654 [Chaetomium olivicolor]